MKWQPSLCCIYLVKDHSVIFWLSPGQPPMLFQSGTFSEVKDYNSLQVQPVKLHDAGADGSIAMLAGDYGSCGPKHLDGARLARAVLMGNGQPILSVSAAPQA